MPTQVKIIVRNSNDEESFKKALSIFTKKVNRNGHIRILREINRGYKKPSEIRHQKQLDILHKKKITKRNK